MSKAMRNAIALWSGLGALLGFPLSGNGGDWPRFLGPSHNAKADPADAQGFWPEGGLRKKWEFPKGKGWACPAVAGNKVLVFHRMETREILDCVEAESGKTLWSYAYEAPYRDRYGSGDGPRSSPVVEGECVYVFGVSGLLHCVDLRNGKLIWERDVAKDMEMKRNFFGFGSTPLVMDGRVIVQVGGSQNRCLAAFSAADGKDLWVSSHEWGGSYASPVPAGKQFVVAFVGGESRPPTGGVVCVDASSGAVRGEKAHRATIAESVNAASPLVFGGSVFSTEGYGTGGLLCAIRADGSLEEVWRSPKLGSQFLTPIEREGLVLGFDGQNGRFSDLVALDARTGEEKWKESFGGAVGRGNLVDLGGAGVLVLGEFGELLRIKVSSEGAKVEQRIRLWDAPETWTMPVLAGRRLYVSQNERGRDGSVPRIVCYEF